MSAQDTVDNQPCSDLLADALRGHARSFSHAPSQGAWLRTSFVLVLLSVLLAHSLHIQIAKEKREAPVGEVQAYRLILLSSKGPRWSAKQARGATSRRQKANRNY